MKTKMLILSLLLATAAGLGFGPCNKYPVSDAAKAAVDQIGVPISREVRQETPLRAIHYSKTGISAEQLALIDAGITERQADAIADGFKETSRKGHSFFEVVAPLFPCVPSPVQRIPSFMTRGGYFYDGTEYDQYNSKGPANPPFRDPGNGNWIVHKKDGKSAVFAAEKILGIGTPGSTIAWGVMIACSDPSILKDAVANGVDHIYLANFPFTEEFRDRPPYDVWVYFNGTILHQTGSGHPLIPRGDRIVDQLFAGGDAPKPEPSIITETPISGEQRKQAEGFGLTVPAGAVIISSSTEIVRAVK